MSAGQNKTLHWCVRELSLSSPANDWHLYGWSVPGTGFVGIEVWMNWLVLGWEIPLVVLGGSHRGLIRDRAPPPPPNPTKRRRGLPRGLGAGLSGWAPWKSVVRDRSKMSSALTQDRSSGPYPSQSTKYWSTLPRRWESKTSWNR